MFGEMGEKQHLASDDGDGWERLPEGGQVASSSVVSEGGAGALDAVHQPDQALHGSHDLRLVQLFLFDLPLCFASETRLLRNRAFSWARGGMEEPKTEGRLTERRRFEEESPGKKENLPAKEAKPRRQGRRRPPPRMMTRFALNSTGQLSHGRRLAGQLFCLLAQAQAQPRMAHILSFSLSFFFPTFRQLQPPSPSVRVRAPRAPLHLLLGEGGICQQIPP